MPNPGNQPVELRCSFCNKHQRFVRILIAGPGVTICNECVDICVTKLEDVAGEPRVTESGEVSSPVIVCGLCRTPAPADQCLHVPGRGVLCAGCTAEVEAALGGSGPVR